MIGLAIDRHNKAHLIDFSSHNGRKYSVCGIVYLKGEILNTLELDGAIPEVCRNCYEAYETMYEDDLNDFLRESRGKLFEKRFKRYHEAKRPGSALFKYWDMAERHWEKLTTYQNQVTLIKNPKHPNARKYGDDRKHK